MLLVLRNSLRHPRKVLVVSLVLLLVLLAGTFKLKTLLALEDVVDPSFSSKQQLNYLLKEFKVHNSLLLTLKQPTGGWREEDLCAINHWLTAERVNNSSILNSTSPLDIRHGQYSSQFVLYPRFLRLSCMEDTAPKVLPEALYLQTQGIAASPWGFSLLGAKSEDWLVQIDLNDAPEGTRYGSFDPTVVEGLHQSFDQALLKFPRPLQFSWIGTADFQYYLYVGLKRVNVLNLGLLLLLILLFRWLVGTWRAGLLYCLSIIVTGILCYGLMGWLRIPVDILSKSLFLMIAVAALEDFVYLAARTYELKGDWRKAWRQILVPGWLTSLTTVLGFLSLCVSDLQIIRRFGFWAAMGSAGEWLVIFVLCPALMMAFPWWSRFTQNQGRRGYDLFNRVKLVKIPRQLCFLLLIVFLFVPTAFRHLNVKDVPFEMFALDHPFKKGIIDMKERNGWEAQVSLVFTADPSDEEIRQTVAQVEVLPGVVKTVGSLDFTDYFTKDAIKPEIRRLVVSEMSSASFMDSWISQYGDRRYNLFLHSGDTESIAQLQKQVQEICQGHSCYLAGVPIVYSEFSQKVPETLLSSFSLSLVLVSGVLVWLVFCCGSLRQAPWILLSSFWGPSLMLLLISAFSIKVNFLTCIFASVLVGLTGDNAIQFLVAARGKSLQTGLRRGGGAALVSGFLMATSSLIFIGSYFIPPRTFGFLLMAGFLASTLGDYWLLQAMLGKEDSSHD